MKRFQLGLFTAVFSFLVLSLLLTGCGKHKDDDDDDDLIRGKGSKVKAGGGAPKASTMKPVTATEYGVIRGKVAWTGDLPDIGKLTDELRGLISKKADDRDYCMSGKDYETTEQVYRIGDNKGLGHVFVWIEPEAEHYFEVPADQLKKYQDTSATISQPHCAFLPHTTVLFPSSIKNGKEEPTGQETDHQERCENWPQLPGRWQQESGEAT